MEQIYDVAVLGGGPGGFGGGFGGGVPGLGDEKYGGDGVHLLSVVESL